MTTNSTNAIFQLTDINFANIVFTDIIKSNKGYIVSKMWYTSVPNTAPHTLYVQIPYTKILRTDRNTNLLLTPSPALENFMEQLDHVTINFIKAQHIREKYNIDPKIFKYNTLITDVDGNNIFSIRIANDGKAKGVVFFEEGNRVPIDRDVAMEKLRNTESVKLILQVDGLIIDLNKKLIYTNVSARYIEIKKIKPRVVELSGYCFIDDDVQSDYDIGTIMLNVGTDVGERNDCVVFHNVVSHDDGIVPRNVVSHNDSVAPHNDDVAPHNDSVVQHNDRVVPHNDSVAPHNDSVAPHNDSVAPRNDSIVVPNHSAAPHNDGVAPRNDSVVPHNDSVVPPATLSDDRQKITMGGGDRNIYLSSNNTSESLSNINNGDSSISDSDYSN